MSMNELSRESHVSKSTIYRMIGTGEGMLHSWKSVAKSLGCNLSDLIGDEDEREDD